VQYSVLRFGRCLGQSLPCQNSPSIIITILYLGITMSGLPGNFLSLTRYLIPLFHKSFRRISSSCPPFECILDISKLLRLVVFKLYLTINETSSISNHEYPQQVLVTFLAFF